MKRVLVTGATGFIGSYVIPALLDTGCTVIASSRDAEKAAAAPWFDKTEYVAFDIREMDDQTNYMEFFGHPDLLIHLAWEGLPNYKSDFHLTENLPRHERLLHNMMRHGLKDITVTGTCFEYGMQEGALSEEMPALPTNPYGAAKNELRIRLERLAGEYGVCFRWLRLFYMYGAGQNPNSLFSQLVTSLSRQDTVFNMSGGEQVRDFLPVEELAVYIVKASLQQKVQGIINCCSGEPVTVKELVTGWLKEWNRHIGLNLGYYPYADYEPMRFWGDNRKLQLIINSNNE